MTPDNVREYLWYSDASSTPAFTTNWTLTSPDATIWGPTVTTDGIMSFESDAAPASSIIFIGLDGLAWTPSIDNSGIVTVTSGSALTSAQTGASLLDGNGITWYLYVDTFGQIVLGTHFVLSALLRFPSVTVRWTPTSGTDTFSVYSVRAAITVRRFTA